MNIDFPPPSKGTYNNAGSSRRLCNYLEHEDMERMEQGIYTEGFFNLAEDNLYKSQVVKDIDNNKSQLLKTDAKFYAIHVSPSEKELQAMGATEQEQAEAMKRYIREVVIPEYAKNFNKGLSAEDIKFYGKIHFDRDRSANSENNMHCHLIVSRKDQSNKIKLSPLTNHKNTKKGTVKGGFDRTALFQNIEKGFDRLFNYNRQLTETFKYCNTMKNGSITDQLKMQQREYANTHVHENVQTQQHKSVGTAIHPNVPTNIQPDNQIMQSDLGLSSVLGLFTPNISNQGEEQAPVKKKKKKPKRGLGQ
ncbi:clindamycin resistance transfer factor BtgB [Dysgonomonas capnocytophagoides]|uniref:Clindamycin resistance transfer factor BtgB n=1 Tax=Dysgonomonas capnocytophagoides TaxID=45254 RepID=A0A4Y8L469_9BACT|nr:DUF5712 family protein [Dysgonomonas capnocytophagoides]TFD96868.1 clindamycin resistance transfer factor BtgB [Dysgonomonas capnocytophagoides]